MNLPGSADVLLDTDVLSFLFNNDQTRAPRYWRHLAGKNPCICFVTAGEVRFGAIRAGWGAKRRARLDQFLERYQVYESTPEISAMWARVRADAFSAGTPISTQDAWIASVALCHELPLITHNAAHFAVVPALDVISESDVDAAPDE